VATQTQWLLVDDLDGSHPATTVEFGIDGRQYAIDLSTEHAAQLRAVLGEFIAAARVRHGIPAPALRHAAHRQTVTAPVATSAAPVQPPSLRAGFVDVIHELRAGIWRGLFEILTALLEVLRGRLAARRIGPDGGA
jgi:hypothetical protein